jgi:hypothetical protein
MDIQTIILGSIIVVLAIIAGAAIAWFVWVMRRLK